MKPETLFRAIGEVPEAQIAEADRPPARRHRPLLRLLPAAACLALLIGVIAARPHLHPPALPRDDGAQQTQENPEPAAPDSEDQAPRSRGVTITPFDPGEQRRGEQKGAVEDQAASSASMDLAWFTPEELLERDTWIFRGTVEAMAYYTVDEIGSLGGWFTVAEVHVTDVLRGELAAGDTCRVLLPVVRGYMSNSIAGALEDVEVGSEAIFMPRPATPETVVSEGDRSFCYADVADAYFSEGIRFIFLQTADGLRFERGVYADIKDARTLDEVAEYIRGMLK